MQEETQEKQEKPEEAEKREKHVSIDDPSPSSSGKDHHKGYHTPGNGETTRRGVLPIPKHMLSPGQDGYRTPTIEDYELHNCGPTPLYRDSGLTNNNVHFHMPQLSLEYAARHSLHLSNGHIAHAILEKLHWRERIRHYTWTFFTLTMATGGIANVLYEGTMNLRDSFGHLEAE